MTTPASPAPPGTVTPAEADARRYLQLNARFVGVGSDQGLFRGATQASRDRFREADPAVTH